MMLSGRFSIEGISFTLFRGVLVLLRYRRQGFKITRIHQPISQILQILLIHPQITQILLNSLCNLWKKICSVAMIVKGPYPDVAIPQTALTPFVLHRAKELGDKPALIEGPTGRTISYTLLADLVSIAAYNLSQRGLKKGDVFGILSPNCLEYAIAFHAVATLGGIVTPINPLYTKHEIAPQLKDCGARFLVTAPACVETTREAAAEAGVEKLFVFGSAPGATSFDSLL